jgi:aminobenzoyl-glutamate utilization protein A
LDLARAASADAVVVRRDLHQYPEVAYTEIRTASKVARRLKNLGYEVHVGREVMAADSLFGIPPAAELEVHYERARADGADPEFAEQTRGGFTAVVGVLKGGKPGPVTALRVDMDALPIPESKETTHFPVREGFSSRYTGLMHACGHDGHTAIGLAVAEVLAQIKAELSGTVKLIFQPGEEGGKGALPMTRAGVVDDVNYLLALHLGGGVSSGTIHPRSAGFLSTTKLDVTFKGAPAHAGGRPEEGRNALIGAAQAALGLYAISRHSAGRSRVNVGVLRAGSGRNIIADTAYMMIETRGETAEIDAYLVKRARAIIQGAALAQELEVEIIPTGSASTASSDAVLGDVVAAAAARVPGVAVSGEVRQSGGSEDCTYLMRRVQEQGGLATYIGVGSDIPSGHHTRTFDFQEKDLFNAIATLALAVYDLGQGSGI